jgi:aminoglycoside phosphotransferase (APT) family kinase protein
VREAEITVEVVSCLIAELFPRWADLEIRPVDLDGWDNTTFRHGEEMSVGLPSDTGYVPQIDKEQRWLPFLAPQLPLRVPNPIAMGEPGYGSPAPWSIYGWLSGEPAGIVAVVDHDRLVGGPPPGPHSIGTRMGSSTTSSPITA